MSSVSPRHVDSSCFRWFGIIALVVLLCLLFFEAPRVYQIAGFAVCILFFIFYNPWPLRRLTPAKTTDDRKTLFDENDDLNRLYDLVPDLICIVDLTPKFIRVNQAFSKVLGYAQEELIDHCIYDFIHPEDIEQTKNSVRELNEKGEVIYYFTNRYRHKDGSWVYLSWNATLVPEQGRIYGVARDVSEEVIMRSREQRHAAMLMNYQESLLRIKDAILKGVDEFYRCTTRECARVLEVDRVSIWSLENSSQRLTCLSAYIASSETDESGMTITAESCPSYFKSISNFEPLIASDAISHPALAELQKSYIQKKDIQSLLDLPLKIGNKLSGVICCEAVGQPRAWSDEEVQFMASVSDTVLLAQEYGERLEIEAKLLDSEAYNRAIVESSEDCLKIITSEGRLIYMADPGKKVMEVDDFDEIANSDWLSNWRGQDHDAAVAAMRSASAGGFGRFQGYCPTMKGTPKWWDVIITPIANFGDSASRLLVVSRDVTEERKIKDELRNLNATLEERISERTAELTASEERQRLMIEQVQDYAIFMLDTEGHVVSWNIGAERAKGYRADEIIGRHYSCFYSPESLQAGLPKKLLDTAKSEGRVTDEGWRVRKDGSRFWAEVNITAIYNTDGILSGFAKITHDLTQRKATESALEEALAEQRKLTNQAKQGERAKSEFLAVMSHEVRTPMNSIIGFSDLLLDSDNLNEEDSEYVQTIHGSAHSLLRILDDILDYTSVDAESDYVIKASNFDVRQLVQEACCVAESASETDDIEVIQECAAEVPQQLHGDSGRLRQILINLLRNGMKFTERGHVALSVTPVTKGSSKFETDLPVWRFSIQDTGIGIPDEFLSYIFNPFSQVDLSSSRKHGGTGLGLAICKRLVELMGGQIRCHSEVGVGSEFIVELPMAEAAVQEENEKVPPVQNSNLATEYPLNVMVVEDNKVNQLVIVSLLKKLGYEPHSVMNGLEALELYKEVRPNCILMDLQMPEMDGMQATQMIRAFEDDHNLAPAFITALTANTNPADKQRCIDIGMTDYLNKPVKREMILNCLKMAARFIGSNPAD